MTISVVIEVSSPNEQQLQYGQQNLSFAPDQPTATL
jgi:hypothetical protein